MISLKPYQPTLCVPENIPNPTIPSSLLRRGGLLELPHLGIKSRRHFRADFLFLLALISPPSHAERESPDNLLTTNELSLDSPSSQREWIIRQRAHRHFPSADKSLQLRITMVSCIGPIWMWPFVWQLFSINDNIQMRTFGILFTNIWPKKCEMVCF